MVNIPVPPELNAVLVAMSAHDAITLCANSRGLPWTLQGFSCSFRKAIKQLEQAGLVGHGLTFHGCATLLRRRSPKQASARRIFLRCSGRNPAAWPRIMRARPTGHGAPRPRSRSSNPWEENERRANLSRTAASNCLETQTDHAKCLKLLVPQEGIEPPTYALRSKQAIYSQNGEYSPKLHGVPPG